MTEQELVVELPPDWCGKRGVNGYVVSPRLIPGMNVWLNSFGDLCIFGAGVMVVPNQVWLHLISAFCGHVQERND